jgi:hypothetical protein
MTTSPPFLDPQGADHEHRGEHQEQAIILGGQPDTIAEREQQAIPDNQHIEVRALTAAKRTQLFHAEHQEPRAIVPKCIFKLLPHR